MAPVLRALSRPALWLCYFFFSSRRRHTRSKRDWSSDVCSSDLITEPITAAKLAQDTGADRALVERLLKQIGRASCRERAGIAVGAGAVKKKGTVRQGRRPVDGERHRGRGGGRYPPADSHDPQPA